jgi:hypothetical protein
MEQKDRFTQAIRNRNDHIRLYGQAELSHCCDKCHRFLSRDGGLFKVSVIVIDGVTIGHPCCAVHNCHIPLKNNMHRFCPTHTNFDKICSVIGCTQMVIEGKRTCSDATHQAVEARHTERGRARFQLKERLERQRVAHPKDSVAEEIELAELADVEEREEEYEVNENGEIVGDAGAVKYHLLLQWDHRIPQRRFEHSSAESVRITSSSLLRPVA